MSILLFILFGSITLSFWNLPEITSSMNMEQM